MNALYRRVYEKQAAFFKRKPRLIALLKFLNLFTLVGIAVAYAWLCAYALVLRSPRFERSVLWEVVGVPALCLSLVSFLRAVVKRPRPYEEGIEPLLGTNGFRNSFPSRHMASATVISGVAIAYLPPLGALLALLSLVVFYVRFSAGWHYPTDLIGGTVLGALCSLLLLF